MVRNGILWTIKEQLYIIDYPILSDQKIKVYRVETINMGICHWKKWCQWDNSAGTMVSAENAIVVSTMVLIVRDKILW